MPDAQRASQPAPHDPLDPIAERRPLDDTAWTLDHFAAKLLRLTERLAYESRI